MADSTRSGPDADSTAAPSSAEIATFEKMMDLLSAFKRTHLFVAAIKLGVFSAASGGKRTAKEIARLCKVDENKKIDSMLDMLTIEKLLLRHQGEDGTDRYENSEGADVLFTNNSSSSYLTALNILLEEGDSEVSTWQRVAEGFRSDSKLQKKETVDDSEKRPDCHAEEKEEDSNPETVSKMAEMYVQFEGLMRIYFNLLVDKVDFSRFNHVLDIGGGTAQLSRILCRRHKHLHCTNFDLKRMEPIARQRLADVGADVADRIKIMAGNCLEDDLPSPVDVVVISNVMHGFQPDQQVTAIGKVFKVLPPGGCLVVVEDLVDSERTNMSALSWDVSSQVSATYGASEVNLPDPMTVDSFTAMCKAAGFDVGDRLLLVDGSLSAIIATKPV